MGGEYQDFPSKVFCLTLLKFFVGESFTVAIVSGTGKVWIRRGRKSRFYVGKFLSHIAEKFRSGIFCCCINLRYRKSWDKRGDGNQDFLSKIFCLTVPKISGGEFSVALISGTENVWRREGVEYQDFPSNNFCLTVPKQFAGNPSVLCFRKFPVAKKFTGLTVSKNFLGEPFRVSLNSGIEEVWIRGGGGIKIFCRMSFVSHCGNFP